MALLLPVLAGCGLLGGDSHEAACAGAAQVYGGPVVGAFSTTVGAIRERQPGDPQPPPWPDRAATDPAILCYVDAEIAMGPPPGPNGQILPSFDRIVLGVVGGGATLIEAGYRDDLPVKAP